MSLNAGVVAVEIVVRQSVAVRSSIFRFAWPIEPPR